MTIWIDADACPREIKEVVYRAADRLGVKTVLVANANLSLPRSRFVSLVRVEKGPDVADWHIVRAAAPGDLAVTADIPLAAELVKRGVLAIDPRGELYSDDNIAERLATRDLLQNLRDGGAELGGPKRFDARAKREFASTFDRVVTRALANGRRA